MNPPSLALPCAGLLLLLVGGCGHPEPGNPEPIVHPLGTRNSGGELALGLGGRDLWVRVAATQTERQQGLQGVADLPDDRGMLFLYEDVEIRRYWMKDCKLDLDILWIGIDGRVLGITEVTAPRPDAPPAEIPRAVSPSAAAYVLELRRGWCRSYGVQAGAELRGLPPHPLNRVR